MDLLRDCVNYVMQYFTFTTNIEVSRGLTAGALMLGICSFAVVFRLIILPMFQTDSSLNVGKGGK